MSDTINVTINAKQISTLVSPDIAAGLFHNKGRRVMALVELKSEATHETLGGNRKVDLVMEQVELVVADGKTGDVADEHVRTLLAALNRSRLLAAGVDDELPLGEEDGPAPKVKDVLDKGSALVKTDADGKPSGLFSHEGSQEPAPV